jgi:polyribonucleotide nucleotidyltransferase
MIPQLFVESIDLGDGRNITIETGRLAKQADGSVVVRIGKTVILNSCIQEKQVQVLPLTVDYRKFVMQAFFPGGFKEKRDQVIAKY